MFIPSKQIVQLFNLAEDPLYEHPMTDPELVAPALAKLQSVLENRFGARAAVAEPVAAQVTQPVAPEIRQTEDPEVSERVVASLKALGYY